MSESRSELRKRISDYYVSIGKPPLPDEGCHAVTLPYIYFVLAPSLEVVKIGRGQRGRVRDMLTACPVPCKEVLRIACKGGITRAKEYERELHEKYADLRTHGEWFRYGGGLRKFIEEHLL